jgi:DNA-binding PadR family transcriptional regulator
LLEEGVTEMDLGSPEAQGFDIHNALVTFRNMTTRNFTRPPTTLELTLVGLAVQQARSGYDFKSLFESTALRQFSSSPGSIYPALKRLEAAGLLRSEVSTSIGDRSRRVYSATEAGRAVLQEWLESEVTIEEMRRDHRLPVLRFSLFGAIGVSVERATSFLQQFEAASEAYRAELDKTAKALADLNDPFPRLALEHGRASFEVNRDWSRRSADILKKEAP